MGVTEYVSPEGLRVDGRRPHEVRQLRCQLAPLARADGSAFFEMGNTKVLAAVYGPREVSRKEKALSDRALVRCEYSMAAFSTGERRKRLKGDRRAQEISMVIRQTFEAAILTHLLPRTQIDIFVLVLQADGGTRTACINAATLALADAGVPMRDLTVACAAGYLDNTALLDLNYIEDAGGGPDLAVAVHPNLDKVAMLQMDAKVSMEVFEKVLELAQDGCKAIATHMRQALLEHTQQLAASRGNLK